MTTDKLDTRDARFSLVLDSVIFPLDLRDLRFVLIKNGYEVSPMRNLPPPPLRISYSGEIARIKEATIFADSDANRIGAFSRSLEDAGMSFWNLLELVDSKIGINLMEKVKYYEVVVHYLLATGKKPLEEISKTENKDFVRKSSEILGEDLSPFSVRLAKKDSNVNQEDWLDIAIEPDTMNENRYHIGVVFRNPQKEKFELFVKSLEPNLLKIVGLMEE